MIEAEWSKIIRKLILPLTDIPQTRRPLKKFLNLGLTTYTRIRNLNTHSNKHVFPGINREKGSRVMGDKGRKDKLKAIKQKLGKKK